MYINLIAEMAKSFVTIEMIADALNVHRNSVHNKIYGKSRFTIQEAFAIQENFFPKIPLNYLFATEEAAV